MISNMRRMFDIKDNYRNSVSPTKHTKKKKRILKLNTNVKPSAVLKRPSAYLKMVKF